MTKPPLFQEDLIQRYDKPGPRYTSYPPATEFHDKITEADFRAWARASNEELIPKPLSLYFHIPFCSSICFYCACNKVITRRKEKAEPYLQDLYHEIEIQSRLFDQDREVRQLHWGGGTPGFLTHEQSQRLMEKIAQHFKLSHADDGEYSIEIDPRVMQKGGVKHLRNLGFNRISIGVQDFDERVQKAVNRIQSLEVTTAVIDEARRNGIRSINIDLIYGLPHQTVESFAETLETIIRLDPDRIAIYNYAHLPHRFPPQRRIQAEDLPSSAEKLAILHNAIDMLCNAGYDYIGMDHFAKPTDELAVAQRNGSLHRNFQGYSAHAQCDSIGFGVSAISQVHDNFSQNAITLDAYHDSLEHERLPVIRGYQSNSEDLLRREIIQGLSCHFHLDTQAIGHRWNLDFAQHFASELERLTEMEEDGLVELGDDEIMVLEGGRLLVRNICMVFDAYQQPERVTELFSRTV
ncbi:MAG: oxygen-independent coproporphyrinogen III oxidase [Gammaproteobacteria bacterium]|nr:MAG: oxygen-independent coproporphyrinogen III oxidase [Gammaproteobacteria bacterium]UCH41842.1 MAG: oxygen-independent coproporphyrinogen III oxidase [Gammaproteobacteria bacterium]